MDTLYWFLAAPGIVLIGIGMSHLLWMALGVVLPKRRRGSVAASESVSRPIAPVRKRPANFRAAHNRNGDTAAVPQGAQHGSGSHSDH